MPFTNAEYEYYLGLYAELMAALRNSTAQLRFNLYEENDDTYLIKAIDGQTNEPIVTLTSKPLDWYMLIQSENRSMEVKGVMPDVELATAMMLTMIGLYAQSKVDEALSHMTEDEKQELAILAEIALLFGKQ